MFLKKDKLKPDYNIGDTVWGYFCPSNCSPGGTHVSKPKFEKFKISNVSYRVDYNKILDTCYETDNKDTHVHRDLTALRMKLLADPRFGLDCVRGA